MKIAKSPIGLCPSDFFTTTDEYIINGYFAVLFIVGRSGTFIKDASRSVSVMFRAV